MKTKEEKKEVPKKDVDYFMVPPSVIAEGRFWTEDEDFRNGQLFSNGKDEDGDSAPGELVGKLVDGPTQQVHLRRRLLSIQRRLP